MRVRTSAVPVAVLLVTGALRPLRLWLGQQRGRPGPEVHAGPDRPRRRGGSRRRHDRPLDLDLDHGDGHDGDRHHRHDDRARRPAARRRPPPRPRRRPRPRPRPPAAARAGPAGRAAAPVEPAARPGARRAPAEEPAATAASTSSARRTRAPARGTERPRAPATRPPPASPDPRSASPCSSAAPCGRGRSTARAGRRSAARSAPRCPRTCRARGSRATTCPRRGRPRARAPTSGTVSATTQPLCTRIDRASGNCGDEPKYGCSFFDAPSATTRARSLARGLMIVSCASAAPPRRSLKKAVCCAPGSPSPIDQATIRPFFGIVITPRVVPTLAW